MNHRRRWKELECYLGLPPRRRGLARRSFVHVAHRRQLLHRELVRTSQSLHRVPLRPIAVLEHVLVMNLYRRALAREWERCAELLCLRVEVARDTFAVNAHIDGGRE